MDSEERRKRHDLSYGVYNFRDVKLHFSKQGWTFRPGPKLSYDHYYIKPGKSPKNKQHKRGVDYFLGEAELVAYARKMEIFKDTETAPLPVSASGKRRARSCSSARASQTTVDMDTDSDGNWRPRRKHKRHRRRSGDNAQNPIALSSDSSDEESVVESNGRAGVDTSSVDEDEDEEWTLGDASGGFQQEEDEEEEAELSDEDSPSSSSEDVEPEDEDLEIAATTKKGVGPSRGKHRSHTDTQGAKREMNGNVKDREKVPATSEAKSDIRRDDNSTSSSDDEVNRHKSPRPLLKTSHKKKRSGVMHTWKRPSKNGVSSKREEKRAAASSQNKHKGLHIRIGKKAKSAPRSVLRDTNHDQDGGWEDNEDNSFSLDVGEYGESPPRRPPSRAHSRANSVRSSPATSVVAASPPREFAEEEKGHAPSSTPSTSKDPPSPAEVAAGPATSHSFISSSANGTPTPIITPSSHPNTTNTPATPIIVPPSHATIGLSSSPNAAPASTMMPSISQASKVNVASVWMELTQVLLPPDRDNKYHIRVTVSTNKPPVQTIWMENLSSHEQRESSFIDVVELPGAKTDLRVPTATVLTALFRCLSSQPDAIVIVGPEPRATAEAKTASEKGEVQLQTSTAEKNTGDGDADGNGLTLVVAYPALDLFRVDHHFPMKVVSSGQRLQHLAKEVERLRAQLDLIQADRDKLCEQLRQQEEENERTLSQQVEAQVKARIAAHSSQQPGKEELEQRVAKLVEEQTQALEQAQEKEKRNRDSARRWVFARSDWMAAFEPCQTLMAGATADTETSLLRPATASSVCKYVVEWKEVLEIAELFFQPATSGSTCSITVVKDGVYQVNANVSHDSLAQLRLVISSAEASRREIAPTKVLLYDNKRRVSRVDTVLELRALDQLSLELRPLECTAAPSQQEEWLRTPMPSHNRLLVVVLDEHVVHA
ncbi:hypothetical protein PRIC1_005972 [Phytophthora ramorum]